MELRKATALVLAMAGVVGGCSSSVRIGDDALMTCARGADCPSGFLCHNGMCQGPDAIDAVAPDLAAAPAVSPAAGRAGATFTIDLASTEPLAEPPRLVLGLVPPVVVGCAAAAGTSYRCAYTATGAENDGQGGVIGFDVWLKDPARNEATRKLAGALHLDFAPPDLGAPPAVAYFPAPSNPLPAVARATAGTTIRIGVRSDELLDVGAGREPTLVAGLGDTTIPFALVPRSLDSTGASFTAVVPDAAPDGTYVATLAWTDVAGNSGTVTFSGIEVKTSRPSLLVNQAAVVFVRSPLGNAAAEPLGDYALPAGSYFALEPSETLSTSAQLPAATFLLAGGGAPVRVQVRRSADPGALILGVLDPEPGGGWPRQGLSSPDVASVYVVGIDDAGNESPPVKIENAEWVASSNAAELGASPHALWRVGFVSPTRTQDLAVGLESGAAGRGTDGSAVLARAGAAWRERTKSATAPPARSAAMAYDAGRGRVVLFGGSGSTRFGDTWEWDGRTWADVTPRTPSPSARAGHALAYDAARGRVVMFGGSDGQPFTSLQDTWEWDGQAWTNVTPAGLQPSGRSGHGMVYDAARRRVVLHGDGSGSLQDTWTWDGKSWTNVTPAGVGPGRRYGFAMAYDGVRQRVVLFGGRSGWTNAYLTDTWEWNGTAWANVTPAAGSPAGRAYATMAYDAARGRAVLFGGVVGTVSRQDVLEWDGASWTDVTPAGTKPSARYSTAAVYDVARGRVLLFGGYTYGGPGVSVYHQDTWEWDGTTWAARTGTDLAARNGHGMAFDAARGRVVLFGGFGASGRLQETWEWDGRDWLDVTAAGPGARTDPNMTYDAARGQVVLYGGYDGTYLSDLWDWNGNAWTSRVSATPGPYTSAADNLAYDGSRAMYLCARINASDVMWTWDGASWTNVMLASTASRPPIGAGIGTAYDGARGRLVFLGGGPPVQTWEWDGAAWTRSTASPVPTASSSFAMAFDAARGRTVLFGGVDGSRHLAETWEWDGTSWTDATSTPRPPARLGHALAYDAARGRVVMFGGSAGSLLFGDTWELDASPDRSCAVQFDAASAGGGIARSSITGLRVRAFAGGTFHPWTAGDVGATLLGWSDVGPRGEPGAWLPLASNASGVAAQQPYLGAPGTTRVEWTAASPEQARQFVMERDGLLSFQVRPAGAVGPAVGRASVALDYIEVRVRYLAP